MKRKKKLRIWAKHAAEQIQCITFNLVMSSNFHKKKWLIGSSLLILEQNINRNQEKMVRMFSSVSEGEFGSEGRNC